MILTNILSPLSGRIRIPEKNIVIGDERNIGAFYENLPLDLLPLLKENHIIIGSKAGNVQSGILNDFKFDILYLKRLHKKLCEILSVISSKKVFLDGSNVSNVFNIGGQSFDPFSNGVDANTVFATIGDKDLINKTLTAIEATLTLITGAGLVTRIAMAGIEGINLMEVVREFAGATINRGLLLIDRIQNNPVLQMAVPFLEYIPVNDEEDPNDPIEMGEDEEDLLLGYFPEPVVQNRLLTDASTVTTTTPSSRKARRFKRINRNFLPNLTSGKIWVGDVNNRPIEADPCCDAYEDEPFILESISETAKKALPKAISLSSLNKNGSLIMDAGKLKVVSSWDEWWSNISLSDVVSTGFNLLSLLATSEVRAGVLLYDIAKMVVKKGSGRILQETPETITGFRGKDSEDLIITYKVLTKTQVLIGKNKDGTDLEGYDSPISGMGFISPPDLEKTFFQDLWDSIFGTDTKPSQITIDFKPKKAVSFENQGIEKLLYVNFSKEYSDITSPVEGAFAKNGLGLKVYSGSKWNDVAFNIPLRQWTTATRPNDSNTWFGANIAYR